MEAELNWDCICPKPMGQPSSADLVATALFDVNPGLAYQWVREYPKTTAVGSLSSLARLTTYWKHVLDSAGESLASESLRSDMKDEEWLSSFHNHVIPVLKNNHRIVL